MTFSIAARSEDSALFGIAIASSSPAVAARCAHARSGAGAVATQNITDPALGPRILELLSRGESAQRALDRALDSTPFAAFRQLIVLGRGGAAAIHSGERALGLVAAAHGLNCAAAGNLLASVQVPAAMARGFELASGHFAERLLAALRAALVLGGEAGPIRSAGLLVVREVSWPIIDLRVDWHDDPVGTLAGIWNVYGPQVDDYVKRGLNPAAAPAFGVPGNG
jgi:uncharacterized Ntn-hydrolase superfamily protein